MYVGGATDRGAGVNEMVGAGRNLHRSERDGHIDGRVGGRG